MINQSPSIAIIVERLRRAEIFSDIPEEDLQAIANFCTEETYHEGMVVLQEGSPADHLFVVERGKLALEKKVQLGRHSTPGPRLELLPCRSLDFGVDLFHVLYQGR